MAKRLVRLLFALSVLLGSWGPVVMPTRAAPQNAQDGTLTGSMRFSSAPVTGEAAELVLSVTATAPTVFVAEIELPVGIQLVTGNLSAKGEVRDRKSVV